MYKFRLSIPVKIKQSVFVFVLLRFSLSRKGYTLPILRIVNVFFMSSSH